MNRVRIRHHGCLFRNRVGNLAHSTGDLTGGKEHAAQVLRDMGTIYAFIPRGDIGLQNDRDVFREMPFGLFMFNSVLIVGTIVLFGVIVNSLIAFALARLSFRGRALLVSVIVALMIIPFESVAVPLLLLVNQGPQFLGLSSWIDSYHVQIVPFCRPRPRLDATAEGLA